MKCGTWIVDTETKSGKEQVHVIASAMYDGKGITKSEAKKFIEYKGFHADTAVRNLRKCKGNIKVEIKAVDEPYYGGSSASLEVNYKCDICSNNYYENLPNKYNISEFVEKAIKEL